MNLGSVNVAESMPYIQAMAWYDAYQRDKHQPHSLVPSF